MPSNSSFIADHEGDFSDWIELYNGDSSDLNLFGYGLSDNKKELFKWKFPELILPSKSYLLVWASGKNILDSLGTYHTNFSINADGEEIFLSHPKTGIIDFVQFQKIPNNISFGRHVDSLSFSFLSIPTPRFINTSPAFRGISVSPLFSHQGGFYTSQLELSLSSPDTGATIIYTLDGSDPDINNLNGKTFSYKNSYPGGVLKHSLFYSHVYASPIPIKNRTGEKDSLTWKSSTYDKSPNYIPIGGVFKGTVVRARIFKKGYLPGDIITNTYFINPEGKYTLPVVALTASENLLFDYEKGIYTAGKDFDDWKTKNPNGAVNGGSPANYKRDSIHPAHIEIFGHQKKRLLTENVGFRIHGNYSRAFPSKSIRLYAKSEFGNSEMKYSFFPDVPYEAYKRLILSNSGQDWGITLFRDALIQSITGHLNFETQAFQPAILFLNAEYWGIHSFRERYDKFYFGRRFNIDPEKIDIVYGNIGYEPAEGEKLHYQETIQYIEKNGLKEEKHYKYIQERIDIESLLDYQLAQIFVGNMDWPSNNNKAWRHRIDYNRYASPGKDGRWRWMMFDTDMTFGLNGRSYTFDNLTYATSPSGPAYPNPPWATFLLRKFLENNEFKYDFINRFADQLNSAFRPESVNEKIYKIKAQLAPEIAEHIHRWRKPASYTTWEGNINKIINYLALRPAHQREHIRKYFKLDEDYVLTIDVSDTTMGYVKVNKLNLRTTSSGLPSTGIYPWKGEYFGGVPIKVEAIPMPGYTFLGWKGDYDSLSSKLVLMPDKDISLVAIFGKKQENSAIHYWNFNSVEKLTEVSFTINKASLNPVLKSNSSNIITEGVGNGFFARNSQFGSLAGSHLRINDPIGSQLIFALPTNGYNNIEFSFEARRSGEGPEIHIIEYSVDGKTFLEKEFVKINDGNAKVYTIDFKDLPEVNDNENFAIRILFDKGDGGISGNSRIDNVLLKGNEGTVTALTEPGNNFTISLNAFPNPFQEVTNLTFINPERGEAEISLYDINGKLCQQIYSGILERGKYEFKITDHSNPSGVYFIIYKTEKTQNQYKLLKL